MTALQPTLNAASADISDPPQTNATPDNAPAISTKTWLAVIGSTLAAFMAVINIQIVNAALADVQGPIGAGLDDGRRVLTSFLIAQVVAVPLTRWVAPMFSVR